MMRIWSALNIGATRVGKGAAGNAAGELVAAQGIKLPIDILRGNLTEILLKGAAEAVASGVFGGIARATWYVGGAGVNKFLKRNYPVTLEQDFARSHQHTTSLVNAIARNERNVLARLALSSNLEVHEGGSVTFQSQRLVPESKLDLRVNFKVDDHFVLEPSEPPIIVSLPNVSYRDSELEGYPIDSFIGQWVHNDKREGFPNQEPMTFSDLIQPDGDPRGIDQFDNAIDRNTPVERLIVFLPAPRGTKTGDRYGLEIFPKVSLEGMSQCATLWGDKFIHVRRIGDGSKPHSITLSKRDDPTDEMKTTNYSFKLVNKGEATNSRNTPTSSARMLILVTPITHNRIISSPPLDDTGWSKSADTFTARGLPETTLTAGSKAGTGQVGKFDTTLNHGQGRILDIQFVAIPPTLKLKRL